MKKKLAIGMLATPEEQKMLAVVKKYTMRRQNSDVIRFLIQEKYQKILAENTPNGVTQTNTEGGLLNDEK